MCITPCMLTSIEITSRSKVLPSESTIFSMCITPCMLAPIGIFGFRFFKESSAEEREHAEKLMEYQVLWRKLFSFFSIGVE